MELEPSLFSILNICFNEEMPHVVGCFVLYAGSNLITEAEQVLAPL